MKRWSKSVSYDDSESSHTYTLTDNLNLNSDSLKALGLLDQIIERAKEEDKAQKVLAIRHGNGANAVGESWMVFHLKALRSILEVE